MMSALFRNLLFFVTRILIGATPRIFGDLSQNKPRIYFANHSSHLDAIAVMAALPAHLRNKLRPVAAKDYWGNTPFKKWFAENVLNAVLLDRQTRFTKTDRLLPLVNALEIGYSLLLFPEGTRCENFEREQIKQGLYHLYLRYPKAELIPIYLNNMARSMPKGRGIPVPLICSVVFGEALHISLPMDKNTFAEHVYHSIVRLKDGNV